MIKKTLFLIFLMIAFINLKAQPVENDFCDNAITILPGQTITGINNERATVSELETPAGAPATCVKTFENDLWYEFTTVEEYAFYQIEINPSFCNTPAGLQAMIIQTDECESSRYIYHACANPYAEAKVEMMIQDTVPGKKYLIYIDGYDGTECVFSLSLKGAAANPQSQQQIRQLQNDYGNPPPLFELDSFSAEFINNETTVYWTVPTSEDVDVFLVERYIQTSFSTYGHVIGTVEPVSVVGSNQDPTYSYTDQIPFTQDKAYCYRIVKVASNGMKAYTKPTCITADLVESFFVSPVYPNGEQGIYYINYRNFKKQDLTFIVLNEENEVLKQLVREKEPKRDGIINIDMNEYDPGIYYLRIESKKDFFLRRFVVE